MSSLAPLIGEAWEHRRHRLRIVAAAALATAAVGVVIGLATLEPGSPPAGAGGPPPAVVGSWTVLSRQPYMGVSCPVANSISCDRVGLAVWLKRPARSVFATIAGAPLRLNDRGDLAYRGDVPRRAFTGFLQPAGIVSRLHVRRVDGSVLYKLHGREMWIAGPDGPLVPVRLTIHEPGGRTVATHVRVQLGDGWG